jgi:hypothetical protein
MIAIFCGSREWTDVEAVRRVMRERGFGVVERKSWGDSREEALGFGHRALLPRLRLTAESVGAPDGHLVAALHGSCGGN